MKEISYTKEKRENPAKQVRSTKCALPLIHHAAVVPMSISSDESDSSIGYVRLKVRYNTTRQVRIEVMLYT